MHFFLGSLVHVSVKYTYVRGKTIYYQRPVPTALQSRYSTKLIKLNLKTSDPVIAAKKVAALNARYEAEWAGLLASPEASPASLKAHADALLREFGLRPGMPAGEVDPDAEDAFHNHLDKFRERHAAGDEEVHRDASPSEFLPPVELEALNRLQGKVVPLLSDALDLHLSLHKSRDDEKFRSYESRAFNTLTATVGNKPIADFTRADARRYVETALAQGAATTTVQRRLNTMRAVFSTWFAEHQLAAANPFERLQIPGFGKDKKERKPFAADELTKLFSACSATDDEPRWLLAMLIDTGARLAEIAGLALTDLVLDGAVPYMSIQEHPWRRLKNHNSTRKVPLVGASLWAAQRVVANASKGQLFAFPRYANAKGCNSNSASATLNKFIKAQGLAHVAHELRHSIADRLRNVGCPKEIRYAIDGHAAQDVGDTYGDGFGLPILRDWLLKVELTHA